MGRTVTRIILAGTVCVCKGGGARFFSRKYLTPVKISRARKILGFNLYWGQLTLLPPPPLPPSFSASYGPRCVHKHEQKFIVLVSVRYESYRV